MRFRFRIERTRNDLISRPLIPVRLTGPGSSGRFIALLDSGADRSMIPSEIADILGLDIDLRRRQTVSGIGGNVEVVRTRVRVTFARGSERHSLPSVPVDVPMGRTRNRYAILGRQGIFDKFVIVFDLNRNSIEMKRQTEH